MSSLGGNAVTFGTTGGSMSDSFVASVAMDVDDDDDDEARDDSPLPFSMRTRVRPANGAEKGGSGGTKEILYVDESGAKHMLTALDDEESSALRLHHAHLHSYVFFCFVVNENFPQ